jgi:HSP20 family molecular chaperone IbpA
MIVRHRTPFVSRSYPVVRAFDSSFDRVFEQLTQSFFDPRRRLPVVDASWDDGSLVLTVDLPGIPSDAVAVDVAGRALTIGVRTDELQWERTVQLGTSVDPDKVSAHHVDGRLTVTVGAVDAPAVRKIAIDTTPPVEAIESASTDDSAADQAAGESVQSTDEDVQSTGDSSTG